MSSRWITTDEAVEISKYHPIHMRRLLRQKKIRGRKFGRTWQVSKASLLDYIKQSQSSTDKRRGAKK